MNDLSHFARHETGSGLVVFHRRTPHPWTSFKLVIAAGQRHDPKDKPGTAHLLEHLVRFGNARHPRRDFRDFHAWTIEQGFFMDWGATSSEHSVYGGAAMNEGLPRLIDLVSAMTLTPDLNTDILHEMEVIAKERDEQDIGRVLDAKNLRAQALFDEHPLRNKDEWPNDDVLFSMTYDDLRAYHCREYVLKNMALVSSGGIHEDDLLRAIDDAFGRDGDSREAPVRVAEPFPRIPLEHERRSEKHGEEVDSVDFEYSWTLPRSAECAPRKLLMRTLEDALFFRIREDLCLAYSTASSVDHHTDCATVAVSLSTTPENEARCRREVEKLLRDPNAIAAQFTSSTRENILLWRLCDETTEDLLDRASTEVVTEGRPIPDDEKLKALEAVTVDDVLELHEAHFGLDRAHLLIVER